MSLFKRKQSKDKDLAVGAGDGPSTGNSPPVATAPIMGNGQRVPAPGYGPPPPVNGTPPMGSGAGRRMTSNPMPQQQSQQQGLNYSNPSIPYNNNNNNNNNSNANYPNPTQGSYPSQPPLAPQPPQPNSQPPRPPSTAPTTSYPWSTRPIRLYTAQTSPPSIPPSPFPRYGLSVPAFPSHSGHMLIFGGLVHEHVKNDLWSMDVRDCTTMPVKTKGDSPIPRVGHAAAIADRIMLVWGGDTKVRQDDVQDEGLYILDLRTQEWTNVPVAPGPIGRYGHAATMFETRFFVFGGQAEGAFMNDLWAYDIKQLSGEKHRWEQIQSTTPAPPRRTGHILVSHQGKLLMFGGTDGQYHYNDTWSFDIATGVWTELSCIGYIPVPREGHAAAIVDNVVYIFGGRDVNGKDLGDLAAFRITNQRWYMFQNMGPAPTPRSGHAMVAAHGKILVIGGEANASSAQSRDDPALIHVLDTVKIKYPPDTAAPRQLKSPEPEVNIPPTQYPEEKSQISGTPQSVRRGLVPSGSIDSLARAASPPVSTDRLAQMAQPPALAAVIGPGETRPIPRSDSGDLRQQPNGAMPPQRPRREGDDEYRRAMSPPNGPSSPVQNTYPVRVTSPNGGNVNGGPASPPQQPRSGFNASLNGTRSPSPRLRMADGQNAPASGGDRAAPPPDAFYYGRSPTANGFGAQGRPSSLSGAADLMRELRSKEGEIDAGRKREAALRVIIGKAVKQGFDLDDDGGEDDRDESEGDEDGEMIRKLTDALLRLKQEKAAIQIKAASDKAMEAERLRRGALQEAAFFRAKVATLESNSPIDLARIEKERINELERQLSTLHTDHQTAQRDLERLNNDTTSSRELHTSAVEREAETLKRAEDAEEAHRVAIEEMEELEGKVGRAEQAAREHAERSITLSSTAQQREAERDHLQAQLDDAVAARDEHVGLIEQAQAAISAAGQRTAEMEGLYNKSNGRVQQLEEELAEMRSELEVRTRDAELAQERLNEIENAYSKSREEADSLRTVTTSRLGELLDSHKEMRADEGRLTRGHQEQLRALEEEGKSLRKMLREAGQRVDAAESGVSHHRNKARELEVSHQGLRGEIRVHRTRLLNAQAELGKYRELHQAKDGELREREAVMTELETRCTMLRNLLADHGIAVNDNDLNNAETPTSRELESKLRDRTRAHENTQREVEELTRRCHEAEDKVESLGRLVDRMKDARSPTSMSMRSPTPPGDSRIVDVEKKMFEMQNQHKEKLAALEGDYQTAVRYVKGTEKMLKRMKEELNKQKGTNERLQSEIDGIRGRPSEAGSRTREASGRGTPTLDNELKRRMDTLQTQHNTIQAELSASRDVLAAKEREVEVLRKRCEDAEREVEVLREDLAQAKERIDTLLEMEEPRGFAGGSDDESGDDRRRGSGVSSEEASMAFDKFTKELKQWERSRSPQQANGHAVGHGAEDDGRPQLGAVMGQGQHQGTLLGGHRRHSSEYSGDWVQ